jgi:hypothetical protein
MNKNKKNEAPQLYKCEPTYWLFLPKWIRTILAWTTIIIFCISFLSVPISIVLIFPITWKKASLSASVYLGSMLISMLWPLQEWPFARKIGIILFALGNILDCFPLMLINLLVYFKVSSGMKCLIFHATCHQRIEKVS